MSTSETTTTTVPTAHEPPASMPMVDLKIVSVSGAVAFLKETPLGEAAANVLSGVLPLVQGFAEYTNVELLTEAGVVLSPYSLLSEYDFVEGSEVTLTLKPIPYSVTASKNHVQRLLQLLKSPPTFCDIGVESKEEPTSPQPSSTASTKNINNPTSVDSTKSFFTAPVGLCFSALPALPSVPSLTPSLSLLSKTTVTQKLQSLSQKDTLRGVLNLWTIKTHGATTSVVSTVSGYKLESSSKTYDTILSLLLSENSKFSNTWNTTLDLLKLPSRQANYLQTLSQIYKEPNLMFGKEFEIKEDLSLLVQGRTWSRDISDVRKMKSESVTERSSKLQTQIKIQTDFTYTCVQILKSIISGFLQPLNPGASDSECVYLSNDILVSHPSIPSSYSVHSSSEATSKMLKKEVTYQPLLAPLSTTNLMLEYLGVKYCFIVLVPGVMSGSDFLRVGRLEAAYESKEVDGIVKEIFESLGMKSSKMLKEEGKEEEVDVIMPVEAKAVRGDNGEYYILECGRLTGLDNLWLNEMKDYTSPTKKEKEKNYVRQDFPELDSMRVYRYELDNLYGNYQRLQIRDSVFEKLRGKVAELEQTVKKEVREEIEKIKPTEVEKEDEKTAKEIEEIDKAFNEVSEKVAKKYEGKREEYVKEAEEEQKTMLESLEKVSSNINVGYNLPGMPDDDFDTKKSDFLKLQIEKLTVNVLNTSSYPGSGVELCDSFHEQGINLRYLGYVADRSYQEHMKEQAGLVRNKRIPVSWLQMLEVEMISRAASRVLKKLLGEIENKLAIVAEVFNAVMCDREETVSEVERRGGDGGDECKGFGEIWENIKSEVGRRFRYNLKFLPNNALALALLTRMCELNGVKIVHANYAFTSKVKFAYSCNYPLAALDIVSIDCLVRGGSKASNIGFGWSGDENTNHAVSVPAADRSYSIAVNTFVQNGDVRVALEAANMAAELYAEVCGIGHRKVTECVDLISRIMLRCGEVGESRRHQLKVMAGYVGQGVTGYKIRDAHKFSGEAAMHDGQTEVAVGHFETAAAIYEINCGPDHPEIGQIAAVISTIYEKSAEKKPAHLALAMLWIQKAIDAKHPGLTERLEYVRTLARLHSMKGEHDKATELCKSIVNSLQRFYQPESALVKNAMEDVKKYIRLRIENSLAEATEAVDLESSVGGGGEDAKKKKKKKKKPKKK
ncbi:hypothetical protein TrLO_g4027 [Triparma laevis f. longispina]|uniref:Clu domain-containing protein n=1 Tax=Triparma laevis f. longispina TaxID=1714387 RepID=A0A9W7AT87_9STRA|nr:hypothetical protein TrLO_g4027 [Triparma laevis f. longispina]